MFRKVNRVSNMNINALLIVKQVKEKKSNARLTEH